MDGLWFVGCCVSCVLHSSSTITTSNEYVHTVGVLVSYGFTGVCTGSRAPYGIL